MSKRLRGPWHLPEPPAGFVWQHDGWDGRSQRRYALLGPCGCTWTGVDQPALLRVADRCGRGLPASVTGHANPDPHIYDPMSTD